MRQDSAPSVLRPEDWRGVIWTIFFLFFMGNLLTLAFFEADIFNVLNVSVAIGGKFLIHILMGVHCLVNIKHDDSDRTWNLMFFVITVFSVSVVLWSGFDTDNFRKAADAVSNNVKQNMKQSQATTQYAQPTTSTTTKQYGNAWYNVYLQNRNSGSNYSRCAQLLKNNDLGSYEAQKCNTGAPIAKHNISTCQKWQRQGNMSTYQQQGCGWVAIPQKQAWCNLNVGQPGQNRANYCNGGV